MPARVAAALMFRGHIRTREVVDRKADELLALLAEEGLEADGSVMLLQYHPPFTCAHASGLWDGCGLFWAGGGLC